MILKKKIKNKLTGRSRKGEAAFISYILLTLLMIVLGMFVLNWLTGYVKSSGKDIKRVVYNYNSCDSIGVSIDNSCRTAEYIIMNLTNRNNLRVNALIIRAFDSDGSPDITEENITIKPGKQKELKIDVNITNATQIQIVPIMYKDDMIIICSDKATIAEITAC